MYTSPEALTDLIHAYEELTGSLHQARLLVGVELTFTLAELLGFQDEPISVGWVLLSRMPLRHPILATLTPEQRRMWARAPFLIPYSSRFAWEAALAAYAKEVPNELRNYDIQPSRLDEQLIDTARKEPLVDALRREHYLTILATELLFHKRKRTFPQAQGYEVTVRTEGGLVRGTVRLTKEMVEQQKELPAHWLGDPRLRKPIKVDLVELQGTALFLDEREQALGARIHWVNDLGNIRICRVHREAEQVTLGAENLESLVLDGAVHLPGIVSAGKTTLAKLIIAHFLRQKSALRFTLVVGDTNTALQTAHQFNEWFCGDSNGEDVVAVPLSGVSQRELHLERLLASREYTQSLEIGRPHWAERWLNPICPLASQIQWEGGEKIIIPAGKEPCERLRAIPTKKPHPEMKGAPHLCPLFARCPSKQLYRDMPQAMLWVTTPGALSQAALPRHLDPRIGKLGDLVYEQSDLVIFDEVETVMEWFDHAFAQTVSLTNGENGLLDQLDPRVADYLRINRTPQTAPRRWMLALRDSVKTVTAVLSSINTQTQDNVLRRWVSRGYFTPNALAYRLARRLAGLKEWDDAHLTVVERHKNESQTKDIFSHFDELLNRMGDPLRLQLPRDELIRAPQGLVRLMQQIHNVSDDVTDEDILVGCQGWIERYFPDMEVRLAVLKQKLTQSDQKSDQDYLAHIDRSVEDLALRLQFFLNVALLERHSQLVFHEWHHKPEEIRGEQPFSRIPRGMMDILPLPLIGRQYGLYTVPVGRDAQPSPRIRNMLSLFAYTNIGRSYLLDFHHLREALDGRPGPNILALSGTSYLPGSTKFHLTLPPYGVLLTPQKTEKAIQASRFILHICRDDKGQPITISGKPDKEQQLRSMMRAFLQATDTPGGFLGDLLATLNQAGQQDPEQWSDRARLLLLVNSYAQAEATAQALREGWREAAHTIYHLKRSQGSEDYVLKNGLQRVDIEQFARTGGRILVAPMQAIGRGFNILNNEQIPKAALGAVFFLTRPMWQPQDMDSVAQELNRYALEWVEQPDFSAWQRDSLYERALEARKCAETARRAIERRSGYRQLYDEPELGMYPRRDLAVTTAGLVIQAIGRLLRGGVPFYAYFTDAAWSPEIAKTAEPTLRESEESSLLTAMIDEMCEIAEEKNVIGARLYRALADALSNTENRDGN